MEEAESENDLRTHKFIHSISIMVGDSCDTDHLGFQQPSLHMKSDLLHLEV